MLQNEAPYDFVVASGTTQIVRQICEEAFECAGVEILWSGQGVEDTGCCSKAGNVLIRVNKKYFWPVEAQLLRGDPSKIKTKLGWSPNYNFQELVKEMMPYDLQKFDKDSDV